MAEKLIPIPLRKPVQEYLTPDFSVGYFTELIDRTDPAYRTPVRGMPYASIRDAKKWVVDAFPELYFVRESRWNESDKLVLWIFSSDPKGEDTYNSEATFDLEDVTKPGYTRVYFVRRDIYNASPSLTPLTPLKTIIALNVTAQGDGYTEATVTASNGASITPVISGAKIVSLVLTSQGSDVTTAPTITITGNGAGATADAVIQDQSAVLVSQKKLELPEQHPLRNEYVQIVRTYSTLPGTTLTEEEYIPEINAFITIKKTIVANTGQTGIREGGTGGDDLVVTEYKDIDANRRVQIVSTLPNAVIGSTRTFQRVIQFSVPNEIPDTPTLIKAYAIKPPANIIGTIAESEYVTDYAFDYRVKSGYSGPFSATVTRTVSLTAATDTPIRFQEVAEFKNIPITLSTNQGTSGAAARGKIVEIRFPACIHDAWGIDFGNVFTVTGTRIIIYTDTTRTTIESDTTYAFGDEPTTPLPFGRWSIIPVITSTPLTVTFPATSPATIPRGTPIIAAVHSQEWRLGTWINDVYEITLPS
jgi:hypothetical protein